MIQIFTTVVNRPEFVTLQNKLFKKHLKNKYEFHVVDDSIDENITEKFKNICSSENINYHKKPKTQTTYPARDCANAIQWTYDNLIIKNITEDIVLFLDSDMFLIKEFDIEEYMKNDIIGGLPQTRGNVNYIWNGIMFFNMSKIKDKNINFSDGIIEGQMTDVGGATYYYFLRTGIKIKESDIKYPDHFKGIDLTEQEGYNIELHLKENFLHYRAATNWHSSWKSSDDPLKKKITIFEKLIEEILI